MKSMTRSAFLASLMLAGVSSAALAQDINIGVSISTTGPAAALGIPERNSLEFVAKEIGDVKLNIIVLDDAGDPTNATTNARRLITENKVDVILGSATTPPTIAISNVAFEAGVPHFGLGPMPFAPGKEKWSVVMPQPVPLMAKKIFEHMKKNNVKEVGLIGFSDSWGDLWLDELKNQGAQFGLKVSTDQRFGRADTSVTGQALRLVAAKPDAVLVAASGTAAALPQIALRERGYQGPIYQTHGAVTYDFIRIAGKSAEGAILASGPVIAPELQDDSALTKKPGVDYVTAYEAKYGLQSRTQFGAHVNDAFLILGRVIPVALKKAKPGTQEFREAIREALLSEKEMAASQGVYNFTEKDRYGVDDRAAILITVKDGKFAIVK
jgi:branched-chain amino acid transport system substrate-binding protein